MSITLEETTLIDELQQIATQEQIPAGELVAQAVRQYLAAYRQKRLMLESAAWYNLPRAERERYEGQYVAVLNEQVIDSDPEQVTLYLRVRAKYGKRPVLIIPGGDEPVPVYHIRSPRRGLNNAPVL